MSTETQPTTLALTLGKADVERIISETIRTQVAVALTDGGQRLVEGIITESLMQRRDTYSKQITTDTRYPTVLQSVVHEEITKAASQAVKDWVEANRPAFLKALESSIKANTKKIADSMVEAFVGCAKDQYRMSITVGIPKEAR